MQPELQKAIADINEVTKEAKLHFGHLAAAHLNWKPAADKWSVAQCLDHLIVSNETYYPQVNKVVDGSYKKSLYQGIRPLSNFFGAWLVKETGPVVGKPMKNPAAFSPSQSDLPATIVADFERHQQECTALLRQLDKVNLEKTVISSPAAGFITYNLCHLLAILAGHEQRHLAQAINVINHPNFGQ